MSSKIKAAENGNGLDVSADIKSILEAERRAEQLILDAKKEADNIMRHWNDVMTSERMESESKLNSYKTESIGKNMKEVDAEVRQYILEKKKESGKVARQKVDDTFLDSLTAILFRI